MLEDCFRCPLKHQGMKHSIAIHSPTVGSGSLPLAEKERFELSRRYSRPTPLAGAPLRPLEYFSKYSCEMPVAFSRRFLILYTFLPALSRAFCIFSCLPFKMFSDRLMPDGCTARNECRFHSYIDRSGLSRLKKGAFSNG